jgi:hypothetical protein
MKKKLISLLLVVVNTSYGMEEGLLTETLEGSKIRTFFIKIINRNIKESSNINTIVTLNSFNALLTNYSSGEKQSKERSLQ